MRRVVDIGRRIELVPIDLHFYDITLALYRQQRDGKPAFLVHTYSRVEGSHERVQSIVQAMKTLGGMQETPDGRLCFHCGAGHEAACRRVFLAACKFAQGSPIEQRPLQTLDKKSRLTITVDSVGTGIYRVAAEGEGRGAARRVSAIAGGLMKLGEMARVEDSSDTVAFACGHPHDALVGLLLVRAPNVRVVLREAEMEAARGVLAAPSQQL